MVKDRCKEMEHACTATSMAPWSLRATNFVSHIRFTLANSLATARSSSTCPPKCLRNRGILLLICVC
ncbi:hypothetical protein E2C01_010899 [Portunus trituberculatus]|uniref:Uncharacterized protein n=1 Tax=Portunus trituberculatus TaxID=210409 RepID=A0A5B7D9L2_PORTR|nr:hypothetical protein [Portunus trituberculatus]